MRPASQGLDPDDPTVGEIDDRLIGDEQLVALDGLPELSVELDTGLHTRLHPRLVPAVRAGPIRLGPVHRQIGVAKEVVAGLGAELGHHDADAGADEHLGAGDGERLPQGVDEAFCGRVGFCVGRQLLEQDAELIAAPPADRVPDTDAGGEARRDLLEEQVARDVSEGVVDALEPVEVEVQHREGSPPDGPPA